jgi:exoribonuclease-2
MSQVLYEEDGALKVGAVLAQASASLQVESPHGKRSKVKAANVLLEFERPGAAELLAEAQRYAGTLDTEFLWQCSSRHEFGFRDLARDYVGREPSPAEAAGILIKLHSAPVYFHRRGRGRFLAAPQETLKLALAAIEKKKRVAAQVEAWTGALERFECPAPIAALKEELLYAPERNKPETKAFEEACRRTGLGAAQLFRRCGLLEDEHAFHLNRFLHEFFPAGAGFGSHPLPQPPEDLPLAESEAFSLDDVGTTEVDDAFSVRWLPSGELRVGVHIAAPALGIAPGSPLDAIARERLSTAYMPGRKFTMLPPDAIALHSLDHGGERCAVSLYVDFAPQTWEPGARSTRLERVKIAANLRHAQYDALNAAFESDARAGLEFEDELRSLWLVACALEKRRGKLSANAASLDYNFYVEDGHVSIVPRKRGAPLDKLVSELMILANTTWGALLAERDVAAIYRVQTTGKVRLSVHPEAHEGLGVSAYAWMSSPLRRYVDLVNQWQLVAALSGRRPPFQRTSDALLGALRAFEVTHARYDEHQRAMESYWCLRWLVQERVGEANGLVVRENLVRFENLPLVVRVPSLPVLEPGTSVRLEVREVDLLARTVECVFREAFGDGVRGKPAPLA